jgi:hypothetical protein
MSWPVSQDYNEAIQTPASSFADPELRAGTVATNALGIPMPRSGNFADVYEMRCPGGARWAVKCFTRQVVGLRERYQEISRCLTAAGLPFTIDFTFQEEGIRVHGRWYPVLKMQWVEGLTFNEFVRQHLDKPAMLDSMFHIWGRMAQRLRGSRIAHANLQHGNVLWVPGSTANAVAVKLIDYDGMFVPGLAGKPSGEVGHPSYQHPQRLREATYSPEVDRFPLLLIATSLRGLRVGGRALWERYDNGDNLLFRESDLAEPGSSPLLRELEAVGEPKTRALVGAVRQSLRSPLEKAPLLEELLPELRTPAVSVARSASPPRPATPPPITTAARTTQRGIPVAAPVGVSRNGTARPVAASPPAAEEAFAFDDVGTLSKLRSGRSRRRKRGGVGGVWKYAVPVAVLFALLLVGGGIWALCSGPVEPKVITVPPPKSEGDGSGGTLPIDPPPKEVPSAVVIPTPPQPTPLPPGDRPIGDAGKRTPTTPPGKEDGRPEEAPRPEADLIRTRLERAKASYALEWGELREEVRTLLRDRREAALAAGDTRRVDLLEGDRRAFEEKGELSWFTSARLRKQFMEVRGAMTRAYESALKDYTDAKREAEAGAVQKELDAFKMEGVEAVSASRVQELFVGRWKWGEAGDYVTLAGDGTGTETDRTGRIRPLCRWSAKADGSAEMVYPDKRQAVARLAPDGDRLEIELIGPDGVRKQIPGSRSEPELPPDLQKALQAARERVEVVRASADQKLLEAFAAELEELRLKEFGLTDRERRRLLDALRLEQRLFEKAGRTPFSPRMRRAAEEYFREQRGVENRLSHEYDKAIGYFTKAGHLAGAQRLRDAKPKALDRRVVGVFDCTGAAPRNGTRLVLYSDGTTGTANETWKLESGQLVLETVLPGNPARKQRDRCVFESDGQRFAGTGPRGEKWQGTRVDPPQ